MLNLVTLKQWFSNLSCTFCLPCQTHPVQVLQSLLTSWWVEWGVSDEGDIQNVQTAGCLQARFENHCSKALLLNSSPGDLACLLLTHLIQIIIHELNGVCQTEPAQGISELSGRLGPPLATRGPPRVAYIKLLFYFIYFFYYSWYIMSMDNCNYTKAQY